MKLNSKLYLLKFITFSLLERTNHVFAIFINITWRMRHLRERRPGGDIVTLPPQRGKSRAIYTPSHNEPFEDFAGAFQ